MNDGLNQYGISQGGRGTAPDATGHGNGQSGIPQHEYRPAIRVPRARRRIRLLPVLGGMVALLLLVLALAGAGFFLFINGQEFRGTAINRQIEASLRPFLGDQYEARVESAGLSLHSTSLLALSGGNIGIVSVASGEKIATLDLVQVKLNPWSLLSAQPRFDHIEARGGWLSLPAAPGPVLPAHLAQALTLLGQHVNSVVAPFQSGTIRGIDLTDFRIEGASGRELLVRQATIDGKPGKNTSLRAEIVQQSRIMGLEAEYSTGSVMGHMLEIRVSGDRFPDLVPSAETASHGLPLVGLDGNFSLRAAIPYLPDMTPGEPSLSVTSDSGRLRITSRTATDYSGAEFTFRIQPEENKIELDRSTFMAGGVEFQLVGGARPVDPQVGYAGPIEMDLVAERIVGAPLATGETPVMAGGKLHAIWQPDTSGFSIQEAFIATLGGGRIDAAGSLAAGENGSGLALEFSGRMMETEAVKQLWPFFLAPGPRNWVRENVTGGRLENVTATVAISGSRLAELGSSGRLQQDELAIGAGFSSVRFDTHGELPALRNASGRLKVDGKGLAVEVGKATAFATNGTPVEIADSSFIIPEHFAQPTMADIRLNVAGPLDAVMLIADRKPIRAASTISVNPAELSGNARAEVDARIAIHSADGKPPAPGWKVRMEIENGASKQKFEGHEVAKANVVITADPATATIRGKALVDTVATTIDMTEPVGARSKTKRLRKFVSEVSQQQLKARGIRTDPVLDGPMTVEIVSGDGGPDRYKVNLSKAEIRLPWIGWTKGAGIPASIEFDYVRNGETSEISGFQLRGAGFRANGKMSLRGNDLVSGSFTGVSLVGEDDFAVTLKRRKGGYDIAATGRVFEARGTIKQLIHGDGFDSGKGGADVKLTANFGRLVGFNRQIMENVVIDYATAGGKLSNLDVRGVMNGGKFAGIQAKGASGVTTFEMKSNDAGATLAMVDFYRKMQGGRLAATLSRRDNGPFSGPIEIRNFTVTGEERLGALTAAPATDQVLSRASGELRKLDTSTVRFEDMNARIEKGKGYLSVADGIIRNTEIGLTFEGMVFDDNDQMNVRGTFMPLFTFSRLVGLIPLVGDIFSNGKDSGLIGITYRLRGKASDPRIDVNPISLVAPGIFRKAFEFRN